MGEVGGEEKNGGTEPRGQSYTFLEVVDRRQKKGGWLRNET